MSIEVSQLIARCAAEGVDTTKGQLRSVGEEARETQGKFAGMKAESGELSESLASRLVGGLRTTVGGFLDFGSHVGMAIFGFKNLASGAVSLAQSLLGPAESAETMNSAFTTLLGSQKAANAEMKILDQFASKTPFTTMDIDKAGSELIAFKTNASDVVPELTAIGDELGSVGRGTAANMDSIVNIFGKIRTEGKLTIGTMSELSINGIDAWTALEKSTGKTQAQLQTMISQGLFPANDAINDLTKGIEANPLYAGGMARQSNTMVGLVSTLKSNWDQMLASFGSPILKGLEPIIGNLGNMLSSSAFKDFAGSIGQGIVGTFQGIGGAATYVGNVLKTVPLGDFNDAWTSLNSAVRMLFGSLDSLGSKLNPIKGDFDPLADTIQNLAKGGLAFLTARIWDAYTAISGIAVALQSGKTPFNEFSGQVRTIGSLLGGQFVDSFKFAGQQASQISKWFQGSGIIKDMGQEFKNLAHVTLDLAEIFLKARGVVLDIAEHAFAKFAPYIEKILPPLIKFGVAIDTGIAGALKYVMPYIDQALKAFEKFADGVIDRVSPIIDKMMPYIIKGTQDAEKVWVAVWPYLQQILEGTFQAIEGTVQIAWSLVSGIILIGLDLLSGNWKQAWSDMQSMLGGVWDGVHNIVDGGIKAVNSLLSGVASFVESLFVQPFRNAQNEIQSIFGGIQSTVSSLTGSVSNATSTLHNLGIPGFAEGTNYAPGGFAMVGERGPELAYLPRGTRVVPNSQLQQMASASAASGGQPIILVMNDQVVARGLMPAITSQIRYQTGIRF